MVYINDNSTLTPNIFLNMMWSVNVVRLIVGNNTFIIPFYSTHSYQIRILFYIFSKENIFCEHVSACRTEETNLQDF